MTATIQKWGESLAVRLPKHLAEEAHLGEGKEVELVSTEEGVLLRSRKKVRYRLADLVAGITPQNTHPEMDWGAMKSFDLAQASVKEEKAAPVDGAMLGGVARLFKKFRPLALAAVAAYTLGSSGHGADVNNLKVDAEEVIGQSIKVEEVGGFDRVLLHVNLNTLMTDPNGAKIRKIWDFFYPVCFDVEDCPFCGEVS